MSYPEIALESMCRTMVKDGVNPDEFYSGAMKIILDSEAKDPNPEKTQELMVNLKERMLPAFRKCFDEYHAKSEEGP